MYIYIYICIYVYTYIYVYIHTGAATSCRCARLSDALRCRVRAQFYTLCHSDDEKPNADDIKLYSFVRNATPKRALASPTGAAQERAGADSSASSADGDVSMDSAPSPSSRQVCRVRESCVSCRSTLAGMHGERILCVVYVYMV